MRRVRLDGGSIVCSLSCTIEILKCIVKVRTPSAAWLIGKRGISVVNRPYEFFYSRRIACDVELSDTCIPEDLLS